MAGKLAKYVRILENYIWLDGWPSKVFSHRIDLKQSQSKSTHISFIRSATSNTSSQNAPLITPLSTFPPPTTDTTPNSQLPRQSDSPSSNHDAFPPNPHSPPSPPHSRSRLHQCLPLLWPELRWNTMESWNATLSQLYLSWYQYRFWEDVPELQQ